MEKIKFFLGLSMVLLGILATLCQVIFIREFLVIFYGNELCMGLILAVWLSGVAIGAKKASSNIDRLRYPHWSFVFLYLGAIILIPVSIFLIRVGRHIVGITPGMLIPLAPMTFLTFLTLFPLTFIIGYIFPCACHFYNLYGHSKEDQAMQIGDIYIWESIGSFLIGAVFSFFLAGRFDHILLLAAAIIPACLNIIFLSALIEGKIAKRIAITSGALILSCCILLIITGRISKIDDYLIKKRFESINPELTLVETTNSRYQNIAIAKLEDQYSILGNGHIYASFPTPADAENYAHLAMVQHENPKKVLLVGGGIEGVAGEILKYPVERLDYVQLDPALIEITKKYMTEEAKSALSDPRLHIYYVDGRAFVKNSAEKYDLAIINASDPSTAMLNRLYTKEFFGEVKNILKEDGVFTTGIASSVNYLGADLANYVSTIYKTLQSKFDEVLVVPGDRNQFFCTDKPRMISLNPSVLAGRYLQYDIETKYFTHYHYKSLLEEEKINFLKENLETAQIPFLNSDSRPISYYYNLILWDLFAGSKASLGLLRRIKDCNIFIYIIALLSLFLISRLGFLVLRKIDVEKQKRFNSKFVILSTGYFAIFSEIVLIFGFQNIYGYVYERIGMIIAFFMLGLVRGATKMNKLLESLAEYNKTLLGFEIYIFLSCLAIPATIIFMSTSKIFNPVAGDIVFAVLIFFIGYFAGHEFPLASKIYLASNAEIGKTAGIMVWMDLIGAGLGAILAGTLLLPILGLTKACIGTAILKLASIFLIVTVIYQEETKV